MAEARIFSDAEWAFLDSHPHIVWEGVNPVYYRMQASVTSIIDIERYDLYMTMDLK